jgi:hypothetical protein
MPLMKDQSIRDLSELKYLTERQSPELAMNEVKMLK